MYSYNHSKKGGIFGLISKKESATLGSLLFIAGIAAYVTNIFGLAPYFFLFLFAGFGLRVIYS